MKPDDQARTMTAFALDFQLFADQIIMSLLKGYFFDGVIAKVVGLLQTFAIDSVNRCDKIIHANDCKSPQ